MDRLLWAIFAVMALTTAWVEQEIVWLFLLCGFVALAVKAPPAWAKRFPPGRGTPLLATAPISHPTEGLLGPVSRETLANVLWREDGITVTGTSWKVLRRRPTVATFAFSKTV